MIIVATRTNMAQSRRRVSGGNNQPVSRSAPQTSTASGSQPVSLTMTTAAIDTKESRQFSAGSDLSQMSQISKMAEEEKVEQLKNISALVRAFSLDWLCIK
jgi:hypothetical protein